VAHNQNMPTTVVNVRFEAYDVYIGRGRCPQTGAQGEWGNQFTHKSGTKATVVVQTREEAVEMFRRWLWEQIRSGAVTLQALAALHGKRLGCWCNKPYPCHGTVLASAADWAHAQINGTEVAAAPENT
jgi:hypothetical protein